MNIRPIHIELAKVLALAYPSRSSMNGFHVVEQVIHHLSAVELLAILGDEPSTDLIFTAIVSIYVL